MLLFVKGGYCHEFFLFYSYIPYGLFSKLGDRIIVLVAAVHLPIFP